ncbi:MAG: TRAP transporter substrate-binding protein DctP [Chloroflexota bacterium]|nr:TRAP transporter substrate-binding protein DctP [Chloroflexota bacterium]
MRKSIVKLLIILVVIVSLVVACAPASTPEATPKPTPAPEVIKWRMGTCWPESLHTLLGIDKFPEYVEEMSGGRFLIDLYAAGVVVPAYEVFDAVSKGTLEAGSTLSTYWTGKMPAAPFFGSVPTGMNDIGLMTWIKFGGGLELWRELYAPYNIIPFFNGVIPPESFAWSNKPIRSLADFEGLKFRTIGTWADILKDMGVSISTVPGGEIYSALEKGIIDATEYSTPAVDRMLGFHEIAKYMVVPGVHSPGTCLETLVNKDAWEALPDDLKAIFEAANDKVALNLEAHCAMEDMKALAAFKDYGVEIIELDKEVLAKVKELTIEKDKELAAKDPMYAKVMKSYRDFQKEWDDYESLIMKIEYE